MTKLGLIVLLYLAATSSVSAATRPWAYERDASLGFDFSYPRDLFERTEGDGKPSFHYFVSRDAEAKLMVGAWNNESGQTPKDFKQWLLANTGGYDETTYEPRGRTWFVISGYRGDDIYYEKVMFSCGGRVVNVFAITYPQGLRAITIRSWNRWRIASGLATAVVRLSQSNGSGEAALAVRLRAR